VATKFCNKARALEDEVNDGGKHFGHCPPRTHQINNSSPLFKSLFHYAAVLSRSRHGAAGSFGI
jgi:hypothetical protein